MEFKGRAFTPRYLGRYREIIEVMAKHGFGAILAQLQLDDTVDLPRLLRRNQNQADPKTPAKHLRLALEELGPTFVKLGQMLSTRPDLLPAAYITELSLLQDRVPPESWDKIKTRLEDELEAPIHQCFTRFNTEPLASASLGQVHTATLPNGQEVVIKVQRPNILSTIEIDLDILRNLAQLAQEHTALGEVYGVVDTAEEFAINLRAELDYRREGRNADRFRGNFTDEPFMHVPKIYWEHSTRRILIMERLYGIKLDDLEALDAAEYDRKTLAANCARVIIREIFEHGFFHADPHPGNFLVGSGEVLGVMDFGTMGFLDTNDRNDLVRLYMFMIQLDASSMVEEFISMGVAGRKIDRGALERDLRRFLKRYHGIPLEEVPMGQVLESMMTIAFKHRLRLGSDMWLLIKTLTMMEGIGRNLDPDFDLFAESEPYVKRFKRQMWLPTEWGPVALRGSADFADVISRLPRQGGRLLDQIEQGELGFQIRLPELPEATNRLDQIANRLSVSLITSALILALAWLIPALNLTWPWTWTTWLVVLAFAAAIILAIWLMWHILRSD